jgi:hypothetical protein
MSLASQQQQQQQQFRQMGQAGQGARKALGQQMVNGEDNPKVSFLNSSIIYQGRVKIS